ncbi:FAD-dependent oxidoreductase [Candidatus Shapirobacteria bacterium]|nr:FAD-dependent oxidoreductase [Candidatus Shapirobacteria bacterium]
MAKSKLYDCIIVGAGPAGLFAAYELTRKKPSLSVAIIERGDLVENRESRELMSGVGGTGAFSDGKLHFTPVLSHEKMFHLYSPAEYQLFLDEVDKIFQSFGVNAPLTPTRMEQADELVEECRKKGVRLFVRKARHVGSDLLPKIILKFQKYLARRGVCFITNSEAADLIIKNSSCCGAIIAGGTSINAKAVLLAPGRYGAKWLQEICTKNKIPYTFDKIEIGVRVEFPAGIMKKFTDVMYESIFMVYTPTFDDVVRTFCPCPNGYVAREDYDGFFSVNGHSNSDNQGPNSNFALVCEVSLTKPVENTISYALSIAKLASTIGGNRPILQRLADFKKGRRSTWERIKKSDVLPSFTEVTPGDISMALPYRIVVNIKEALDNLDQVMPGLNSGSTLLYAPEIKLRSSKIETSNNLETNIGGLFVAGDAAGLSGSITGAAVTGLVAGRGMLNKFSK